MSSAYPPAKAGTGKSGSGTRDRNELTVAAITDGGWERLPAAIPAAFCAVLIAWEQH
jgi:hypothetical protein